MSFIFVKFKIKINKICHVNFFGGGFQNKVVFKKIIISRISLQNSTLQNEKPIFDNSIVELLIIESNYFVIITTQRSQNPQDKNITRFFRKWNAIFLEKLANPQSYQTLIIINNFSIKTCLQVFWQKYFVSSSDLHQLNVALFYFFGGSIMLLFVELVWEIVWKGW